MNIKCEFKIVDWPGFHNLYTCKITAASIKKSDDRTVQSFIGVHKDGKSDKDVKGIRFQYTSVECFPLGLNEIFPDVILMSIYECGLKEIKQNDLKGLEGLEAIYLRNNQLTSLPSNLFANMTKLKSVNFCGNKLEFLTSKLLEPIVNNGLTYVNFRGNKNIDMVFAQKDSKNLLTIERLMKNIDTNCNVPEDEAKDEHENDVHNTKLIQGFKELWISGNFSDFKIIAGSTAFHVHKNVLSIYSSVFAAMFKKQNRHMDKMNIEDISADAVKDFLRYLYTGEYPDERNVKDTFALAAKLEVNELKSVCERIICKNILSDSNAYSFFMLGHAYASDKLKLGAFNQIKSMFPDADLTDDLMQEPENLKKIIELNELLQRFKKTKEL